MHKTATGLTVAEPLDATDGTMQSSGGLASAQSGLEVTAARMQEKAQRAKRTGNICVGTTLVIGAAILAAFLSFSQITAQQRAERQKELLDVYVKQQDELSVRQDERLYKLRDLVNQLDKLKLDADKTAQMVQVVPSITAQPGSTILPTIGESPFDEVIYNVTASIIRIGAVLVAIFLIQIMVSFARYYYKVSEHLSMTASLITLSDGKISNLKVIAPLLLPSSIDFGKMPRSPIEKIVGNGFEAIQELSKRIPIR